MIKVRRRQDHPGSPSHLRLTGQGGALAAVVAPDLEVGIDTTAQFGLNRNRVGDYDLDRRRGKVASATVPRFALRLSGPIRESPSWLTRPALR